MVTHCSIYLTFNKYEHIPWYTYNFSNLVQLVWCCYIPSVHLLHLSTDTLGIAWDSPVIHWHLCLGQMIKHVNVAENNLIWTDLIFNVAHIIYIIAIVILFHFYKYKYIQWYTSNCSNLIHLVWHWHIPFHVNLLYLLNRQARDWMRFTGNSLTPVSGPKWLNMLELMIYFIEMSWFVLIQFLNDGSIIYILISMSELKYLWNRHIPLFYYIQSMTKF